MRTLDVTLPELAFVAGTRGLAGMGIGLLASNYLGFSDRKKLGFVLLAVGLLTTIPIAFAVGRRSGWRNAGELPG